MRPAWLLCMLPLLARASPTTKHGQGKNTAITNEGTVANQHIPTSNVPSSSEFLGVRQRDFSQGNLLILPEGKTWRVNRKALVPILIGMAMKVLATIPLVLTALTVIGSLAILVSKASLILSGVMFIRRFFSSDAHNGGFPGLNPLGFPHSLAGHGSGLGNRRTTYIIRGRSNHVNSKVRDVYKQIEDAQEKYAEKTTEESMVPSLYETSPQDDPDSMLTPDLIDKKQ